MINTDIRTFDVNGCTVVEGIVYNVKPFTYPLVSIFGNNIVSQVKFDKCGSRWDITAYFDKYSASTPLSDGLKNKIVISSVNTSRISDEIVAIYIKKERLEFERAKLEDKEEIAQKYLKNAK